MLFRSIEKIVEIELNAEAKANFDVSVAQRDTSVMPTEELKQDAALYLMQTYTRQPLSIVRGRGTKVYDLEGREYLDFVGGIAVNILGHGHPDLVQAIQRQAAQLIHTSNLYYTEPQVKLAQP